jgi:hypothetical protein
VPRNRGSLQYEGTCSAACRHQLDERQPTIARNLSRWCIDAVLNNDRSNARIRYGKINFFSSITRIERCERSVSCDRHLDDRCMRAVWEDGCDPIVNANTVRGELRANCINFGQEFRINQGFLIPAEQSYTLWRGRRLRPKHVTKR